MMDPLNLLTLIVADCSDQSISRPAAASAVESCTRLAADSVWSVELETKVIQRLLKISQSRRSTFILNTQKHWSNSCVAVPISHLLTVGSPHAMFSIVS